MGDDSKRCPLTVEQVVDHYFLEHRAKLIDIAAFLDRIDRAAGDDDDFRLAAFRRALALLGDGRGERARATRPPSSSPFAGARRRGSKAAATSPDDRRRPGR